MSNFSRRQFLKLGALVAGAMATVGAARSRALDELVQSISDTAARLPMFRANAQTTGELIGVDGEPMTHAAISAAASSIYGLLHRTALAGSREILTVAAQDEFVSPGRVFPAEAC